MELVKFNKQIIGDFLIPSFKVHSGDMVIVQFPGGPFYDPLMVEMKDIFIGKTPNEGVEVLSPFKYPDHMWKSRFRYGIFPLTVGTYLEKHANKKSPFFTKIYDDKYITPKTKIGTIPGNSRRKLAVYATLSWTNQIVFDLAGVDPMGAEDIYNTVKEAVGAEGAAILIDWTEDFKNKCNVFVKPQYVGATK